MNKENLQLRRLGENDKVAAFDCGDEDLNDFPSNSAYNRFRKQFFAQGKMFKSYPALKICRLATNKSARGLGIGSMMLNTIIESYRGDNKAGCRFITVDAYIDAIPFYLKQGFVPLSKTDEGADTRLLYFDLESVKDTKTEY